MSRTCGLGGDGVWDWGWEWGEGAETSSPLEGARKGSRVGEQLCPVVPHTSSPSTYQSGPGKETGNRRGRHPLPTALQLRHSGSRSCVCSILPAHTAWLTPTGPPPHSLCTPGLQPRVSLPSTAKKFLWQEYAPLQKPALQRLRAGRYTSRVLETLPFLH